MSNGGPSGPWLELIEPSRARVASVHVDAAQRFRGGREPSVIVAQARADEAHLSEPERELLAELRLSGPRRRAWVAGRIAMRAALGRLGLAPGDLLTERDGAPRLTAPDRAVSLSHAGPWVAVAVAHDARHRVAVDLCPLGAAPRLERVLDHLRIARPDGDPAETWTALECLLKLRRLPIGDLLRGGVSVERRDASLRVTGRGDPVVVATEVRGDLAIGRSAEPC